MSGVHQMYPITHHNYTHNSQVKTSLHTHTTHLARDAVDATLHILTHRTRATDATARDGHAVRVPMGAMPTWTEDTAGQEHKQVAITSLQYQRFPFLQTSTSQPGKNHEILLNEYTHVLVG